MQPPAGCSNHLCVYIDQCDHVSCCQSVQFHRSTISLKQHFLLNYLAEFTLKLHRSNPRVVSFQICSKISILCRILVAMATKRKPLLKSSCQKLLVRFQNNLVQMALYQNCSNYFDWLKNMTAKASYVNIEKNFNETAGPSNGDNKQTWLSLTYQWLSF